MEREGWSWFDCWRTRPSGGFARRRGGEGACLCTRSISLLPWRGSIWESGKPSNLLHQHRLPKMVPDKEGKGLTFCKSMEPSQDSTWCLPMVGHKSSSSSPHLSSELNDIICYLTLSRAQLSLTLQQITATSGTWWLDQVWPTLKGTGWQYDVVHSHIG